MLHITLHEAGQKDLLFPFNQIRSIADIRIGILTIREKWEKLTGHPVNFIQKKAEPSPEFYSTATNSFATNVIPDTQLMASLERGENFQQQQAVKKLDYPWNIFQLNDWALREDFKLVTAGRYSESIPESVVVVKGAPNIFIEEGAKLQYCTLNAADGPIYIGRNTEVMEGACIRGPFALCEGAVVKMRASIYGATTIGPYCVVGGEIKNSVFFGYANKAHEGYLGDSVIGEWCNLGAGTSNSNLKNNAGEVKVWHQPSAGYQNAGSKCGLLMGDYSRCAINTSFNTGTVVGIAANVFGPGLTPRLIPNFAWGSDANEKYRFDNAVDHIRNWKKLKNKELSQQEIQTLKSIFEGSNH